MNQEYKICDINSESLRIPKDWFVAPIEEIAMDLGDAPFGKAIN